MGNMAYLLARPFLPEILLAIGASFLLMLGVFSKDKEKTITRLSIFLIIAALFLLLFGSDCTNSISNYNRYFINNSFTHLSKLLTLFASSLILSLYIGDKNRGAEFPVIILFAIIGIMLMVASGDFLSLYLGVELQSLCLYVLASYDHKNIKSSEAGIKYFILSSVSSGITLYGISLIYGFAFTTNFNELAFILNDVQSLGLGLLLGFILVIIGLCFKISAAPFHMWSLDVYEGSPTIVTAFFITVPKMAVMLLITRLMFHPFGDFVLKWQQILVAISILSMLVGSFGALRQVNIKRLLAYSSIGHVGYLMMALATYSSEGINAIINYVIVYIIMNIGLFACIIQLNNESIDSYAGLAKKNPLLAFFMSIILFSMAGIPPFAGFFAKFYLLYATIKSGMIYLAIIAILASLISAYYYLKLIKVIYFDEAKKEIEINNNYDLLLIALICVIFIVLYLLFSEKITMLISKITECLL